MREIRSVTVVTAKPAGPSDLGQIAEGYYFVSDGVLTMCDRDGVPLRDDNTGKRIAVRLLPSDTEKTVAKKLTLQQYRAENRDQLSGFNRSIRYRDLSY